MLHPMHAGFYGPGPWALAGPLWLLFWVFLIGALVLVFARGRRGRWGKRGHWGPWGPGGPGGPRGPWGPPTEIGPDGQPVEPPAPPEVALERARAILHERYAKGEISTEEYRERIDNLV